MRLLFRLLIWSLLCFAATLIPVLPALAHPTAGASDYAKATKLLTKGKNFEQAITLLQAAVRTNPKDVDYHLALGCAYADRAASLGYADSMQSQYLRDKASYAKDLADWQADQKREPSHWPAPSKPPATFQAYTKDDGKPLALSHDQAQARISELANDAHTEYKEALELCKSKEKRANVEYTEGWSILLVGTFSPKWTTTSGGKPGGHNALNDFLAATADHPKSAAYWQSLGYTETDQKAVQVYERSAALQPNDPAMLYKLYLAYSSAFPLTDLLNAFSKTGPVHGLTPDARPSKAVAISFLQKSIARDPRNAYPIYVLASIEMKATRYVNNRYDSADAITPAQKDQVDLDLTKSLMHQDRTEAAASLALISRGNNEPSCFLPRSRPPVPMLLRLPWNYGGINAALSTTDDMPSNAALRELARDVTGGWADVAALQGNLPAAERADHAVIGMGLKLMASWPVKDSPPYSGNVIQTLVGAAIASIGYSSLVRIDQKFGTPAQVKATQAEYDSFKAKVEVYKADFRKNEPASIYAQY